MAPKKKGARKKEEAPKEPEVDENIVPEHSREFYLIQIRDLEGRLARYQAKWDEMQVSEELFRTEYEKMFRDNKEIVAFLKKTLNQRMDEITDLTEQQHQLQQAKDSEKDAFEAQLAQLRHEFQETKDQLTSENMILSGKLAALEEFRLQKDEIIAKFADLEEQLKKQEEDHKEFVYSLERKAVLDKERLKREMIHRVNAVAAEFRKVSNSQMAETTKRTIRENVSISLQLTKITEQSLQLIQENDRLKEANAEALKQLELLEQNEKRMAKNSLSNQKMIVMLTNKCKELEAQMDQYLQQQKAMAELQEAYGELQQQNFMLQEELSMQKAKMEKKMTDNKEQERALQEERQRRMNAERVLKHAAQGLRTVLQQRPSEEEQEDRHFDVVFQLRRNDMLQGVLSVLNKDIARIEANQALKPYGIDTDMKPKESDSDDSVEPLRLSKILSHTDIFSIMKPRAIHSMPSLTKLSQMCVDTMRPYASATELHMTDKTENEIKLQEVQQKKKKKTPQPEESPQPEAALPDVVAKQAVQQLLSRT